MVRRLDSCQGEKRPLRGFGRTAARKGTLMLQPHYEYKSDLRNVKVFLIFFATK
jgi:hypothetical protein